MGLPGNTNSLAFQPAGETTRRLKMLCWGDNGTGKTTMGVQFPNPAVIDLEGGTEHYGGDFQFDVLKVTEADDINAAVDGLLTQDHDYRTLVIDLFSASNVGTVSSSKLMDTLRYNEPTRGVYHDQEHRP